jgi:hypothetical protein
MAMAQAIIHHGCPRTQSQVSVCGICGAQSGIGRGLTQSTLIFPSALFCKCSKFIHSFIYSFVHSLVTDVTKSEQLRASLNTVLKIEKSVTIRKDSERVKCFYNRKKDVTDSETSGYPTNSKFIQTQKKRE